MRNIAKHRKSSKAWKVRIRAERRKAGICLHHGDRKAAKGHTTCDECLEDARLRYHLKNGVWTFIPHRNPLDML